MAKKSNNKSAIRTEKDKGVPRLNRAIYSATDPTYGYPSGFGIPAVGLKAGIALFNPDEMTYEVTDSVADAAWRKRLGLSYDNKFLPINEDGSYRLPRNIEMEIPTDTTMLKRRITANEKLANQSNIMGEDWQLVNAMIEKDKEALEALRKTYKTGKPVVINEYSANSRKLAKNGELIEGAMNYKSPLNVLQNYTVQYNPKTNTMEYRDIYDFNGFESFVPGEPFEIKGSIPLQKYDIGGWLSNIGSKLDGWNTDLTDKFLDSGIGKGLSSFGIKAGGLGGIANTAATAIGGVLAGGKTTGVGNALQGIGSLASNIPGVGGLIGAGVNLLGGGVNALFGSKLNAENIAAVEGDIKEALNYTSNVGDYDALASNYAGLEGVMGFNKGFIGSDGPFSNKAKKKYKSLKTQAEEAEAHQLLALANNAQNIAATNQQLMEANYSAYGGPIDMKYTGVMSPFGNRFKDGGIFIKPSKRGTFTAAAKKRGMGVQEFASKVLANKEDYSPAMVKKANFARNASKWHDDGGPLDTRMELLRRLEEKRNRRGTYGGGRYGGGGAGSLFLESPDDYTLVKDTVWVPYRETFNDAFGRARAAGLDEFMFDNKAYTTELGDNPDNNRVGEERTIEGLLPVERTRQVRNKKAEGGELFTNGVTTVGNGGTHESNPYEGVQMGVDPQGIPNLVEEGEVIWNDYVFSNRLNVPDAVREKYKLIGNKELTFADAAKQMQKESEERPNDPISKRGLESAMLRLQQAQETVREEKQANQEGRQYAKGGNLTWLRYAPVVGAAIGLGQNLFNSPDYSGPNAILSAAESVGRYTPVGYSPIGNYLKYSPFDKDFYINKLNAQAGATRRATTNTSGGNRAAAMAGILASDYNYGNQLGALARQAEEYNLAQRQAVETFNRATNMTNAEMGLKAAMANQEAALNAGRARLSGTAQAMAMRDEIAARRGASMSANLTNLFDSLGNIGIDEMNRADRDMLIKAGVFGTLSEKPQGWSNKRWEDYKKTISGKGYSRGGQLKKKRGGFTY